MIEMNSTNWPFYLVAICSLIISLLLGLYFFGGIVHETSHALACIVLRLEIYSYSFFRISYETSPNFLVNVSVRLAGGIGQSLSSLLLFWIITNLEPRVFSSVKERAFRKVLLEEDIDYLKSPILGIVFAFELGFLTIAFHGIVASIWEGLFFDNYEKLHNSLFLLVLILLFGGLIAYILVKKRVKQTIE